MRKISILLMCIMLLTIPGCSDNKHVQDINYIFKGENDLWAAEFQVKGTGTSNKTFWSGISFNSDLNKTVIVTYKKDIAELSSVKQLEISYKEELGSAKTGTLQTLKEDYDNGLHARKTYTLKSHTTGSEVETGLTKIIVTINLDNKIQTIELKLVQDQPISPEEKSTIPQPWDPEMASVGFLLSVAQGQFHLNDGNTMICEFMNKTEKAS